MKNRPWWRRTISMGVTAIVLAGSAGCRSYPPATEPGSPPPPLPVDRKRSAASAVWLDGPLTLRQAVEVALVHQPSLAAARAEADRARGVVQEAYATLWPQLLADAGYTRMNEASSVDFGGQNLVLGEPNNYSVAFTARQGLYHGGAFDVARQSARLQEHLADAQIRAAEQGTVFAVCKTYLDALLAEELLGVSKAAVESAAGHLADVERRKQQGVASDFDVLRAQVERSNLLAEQVRQQNALHLATTAILHAMGASQESQIRLTDRLERKTLTVRDKAAGKTALALRPEVIQAGLAVRLQEEGLRAAHGRYWPQLDAFFRYAWTKPDQQALGSTDWGDSWTAGLTVGMPLFEGGARRGQVAQAEAGVRQAESRLAAVKQQVLLETSQAVLGLQDAEEMVRSQNASVDRAREGLRLAEVGYREGVNTELQVTDARTALTQARALYHQALHAHSMARIGVRRATGELKLESLDEGEKP